MVSVVTQHSCAQWGAMCHNYYDTCITIDIRKLITFRQIALSMSLPPCVCVCRELKWTWEFSPDFLFPHFLVFPPANPFTLQPGRHWFIKKAHHPMQTRRCLRLHSQVIVVICGIKLGMNIIKMYCEPLFAWDRVFYEIQEKVVYCIKHEDIHPMIIPPWINNTEGTFITRLQYKVRCHNNN